MEQQKQLKQRKYWIDSMRGLAMLFVIFGHTCPEWNGYFVLTSAIKIPLFFAITGYVFNGQGRKMAMFFKNLFFKLIVPWLLLSLFPFRVIRFLAAGSPKACLDYIYSFFSGEILWYMPCCIIAEIILYFMMKLFRSDIIRYIVSLVLMVGGVVMSIYNIAGFAFVNTACIAQGFILIGMLIKKHEALIIVKYRKAILPLCAAAYIVLAVLSFILYPDQCLDVHKNFYYNYAICAAMIFIGCLMCFSFFELVDRYIGKIKHRAWLPLCFIGQNTLVYYICNGYVQSAFTKALKMVHVTLPSGPVSWVVYTLVACIGCCFISIFINLFLPFVVGKKYRFKRAKYQK